MVMQQPSSPLNYVAIGDSLTVGVGSTIFTPGFVERYKKLTEQALNRPLAVVTFAKKGATSSQIYLTFDFPPLLNALKHAELITLTAGGNDFIQAGKQFLRTRNTGFLYHALNTSMANIKRMIIIIHQMTQNQYHPIMIRILNLYNPFPQIPEINDWITLFNQQLLTLSHPPYIQIADIYHAFLGHERELLFIDHIHPNPRGYEVMAQTVVQLGFSPLL
ncbi:GDSL-type esterase/lipase family protein [Terrilactibacillus laevilacticus]|uniref:GDSL-type esterase/lipase family protein n=1 Tax=Terrilactibacillus laevilacticus TaxID=1380157 RepID=A0ABW5PSJ0_9BACI|nr:GDSL-type esterase/lipase family protein [Terrilactibacillus laevilacticus]